ncbi:MAG: hypothetical protein E7021_01505 [Alphaproteobacteria bacterium]|nr:hypothetical protein [Alphaproteobacteria bacterium]
MATEDMKFTEEGLKESIKNGDIETIEKFVSLSGEDILSQLGVKGQYDDLLKVAVDKGDLKMVKTLLKRSNLIQASMDDFIDGLDESASQEIKTELRKFADLEKRSNLQTYKGKWKEWQTGLKKAEENGYDDLAEKLKNRMDFENNRRLEEEGKRPEGISENRWFLNENAWTLNGKGGLEYPMYGQDNSDAIREELKQAGIETEYTWYEDKKTKSSTNYRIRIKSEDKEKLKQFLEQKRQEMQGKEDLEAIVSGREEGESSNDTHEEVVFIDPKHQEEPTETWVPPVVKEETIVEQPKQNKGEKDMPTNKTDYYYTDPEPETADHLAEHASADIKTAVNPVENNIEQPAEDAVENPQAEVVVNPEQPKAEKVQTTVRNTFRDLNNLDAHMPIGQVLARLEDVEFKENEIQKKELFDEIKRQYQLKRENPDYKVQGLNGRINSTDMLKFAQHIDNVIDDGEPDNIDYTQGHTEKIRSLATLDRHLQISEVLARLEDVAAKTQDPNEQALLDLVREGYEEKRKSPENDLSGLNSFVDSTAALNLAKRIDLAIDDGEIENVDCLIMDTVQVQDSDKSKEKDVVQDEVESNEAEGRSETDENPKASEIAQEEPVTIELPKEPNEATKEFLDLSWDEMTAEKIQDLKERGADFNWPNERTGRTRIFEVANHKERLQALENLLENGANPNVQDKEGRTPLYSATLNNDYEMARLLDENGGDFTIKNNDGNMPKDLLTGDANPKLIELVQKRTKEQLAEKEKDEMAKKEIETSESVEIAEPAGEGPIEMAEPTATKEMADDESFEIPEPSASRGADRETEEGIEVPEPRAKASDEEHEGMKSGPGFWANWHKYPNYKFMSTNEGKSFHARPYYFNPSKLTEEEKELARHMLAEAGVKVDDVEAPLDFKKGPLPMEEGDKVWRVTGNDNIKKLKKFLNECQKDEDKALGKKVRLVKPVEKDEKSVDWKGGAKKVIDGTGRAIKGTKEAIKKGFKKVTESDVAKSLNASMDEFNKSVFKSGFENPEQFGSNMLMAMLAFPFDFLDIYLKTKAAKYADSGDSKDSDKKAPSMEDDRKKQHEALKKIMNKMVEKDPELFEELAKKGVIGNSTDDRSQEERAEHAKQFFKQPENEELMNRLKGVFAEVAKEKPGWIHDIYPADYNGPVTPEVLLNHVMGWGNPAVSADKTIVPPTADRTVVPPTGSAMSPEMQAIMQQMQVLTAEIRGLREEINLLKQENTQLKEQIVQLKAENEALRSGKMKVDDTKVPPSIEPSVATNGGGTPAPVNAEATVAPKTEKREIPDLDAVVRTPFMNNLGRSEVNAILEDELQGYKEAKENNNPEQGSREEFLNKVAEAYSGKDVKLNDLIKSDKELAWAEEIASTVENGGENGNGDNFPRTTKEITVQKSDEKEDPQPTVQKQPDDNNPPSVDQAETVGDNDKLKPESQFEEIKAGIEKQQLSKQQTKQLLSAVIKAGGYVSEDANIKVIVEMIGEGKISVSDKKQAEAKKLVEKTEKLSKKKDTLTKAQREFVQSHIALQGIDLNKRQDGFVYKDDGQELSDYAIKQVVGHETKGKYATKTGLIELFQKLHTLDKEVAAQYGFEFKEVKTSTIQKTRTRKATSTQKTTVSQSKAKKDNRGNGEVSNPILDNFMRGSRN